MAQEKEKEKKFFQEILAPIVVGLVIGISAPVVTEIIKDSFKHKSVTVSHKMEQEYPKINEPFGGIWSLRMKANSRNQISNIEVEIQIVQKGVLIAEEALIKLPTDFRPDVTKEMRPDLEQTFRKLIIDNFKTPQEINYKLYLSATTRILENAVVFVISSNDQNFQYQRIDIKNLSLIASILVNIVGLIFYLHHLILKRS